MKLAPPQFAAQLAADKRAVIEIYDDIGPSWAGMIDTRLVARALGEIGEVDEIEVRINSRGGSAFDGIGIHNLLKQHPAKITVRVDGLAASAASLIAMAGDKVVMPANTLMMIHEPWAIALGNQSELRKAADFLAKVNNSGIESYHAKSGQSRAQIAAWLTEETWFTAAEAKAAGLADEIAGDVEPQQCATREPFQFLNPPQQLAALFGRTGDPQMSKTTTDPKQQPADKLPADEKLTAAQLKEKYPELVAEIEAAAKPADPPKQPAEKPPTDAGSVTKSDVELAVKAERKRASDIRAVCAEAGLADKAQAYIDGDFALQEVRDDLLAALIKRNKAPSDGDEGPPGKSDPDAEYKAEYKKNRDYYAREGVSEEAYVEMRRVDDGKAQLVAGSAAAAK